MRPARCVSSLPKICPHHAHSLAGGAEILEYATAGLTWRGEPPSVPSFTVGRDAGSVNDKWISPLIAVGVTSKLTIVVSARPCTIYHRGCDHAEALILAGTPAPLRLGQHDDDEPRDDENGTRPGQQAGVFVQHDNACGQDDDIAERVEGIGKAQRHPGERRQPCHG